MNEERHLRDYISAEDGRVFYVSTTPDLPDWYETMIFECGAVDPETHVLQIKSWQELYMARYDSWAKALEGHAKACNIASAGDL